MDVIQAQALRVCSGAFKTCDACVADIDWCLLEVKRTYLVSAFNYHVTKEYNEFTQIYMDGAKKPETGDIG